MMMAVTAPSGDPSAGSSASAAKLRVNVPYVDVPVRGRGIREPRMGLQASHELDEKWRRWTRCRSRERG